VGMQAYWQTYRQAGEAMLAAARRRHHDFVRRAQARRKEPPPVMPLTEDECGDDEVLLPPLPLYEVKRAAGHEALGQRVPLLLTRYIRTQGLRTSREQFDKWVRRTALAPSAREGLWALIEYHATGLCATEPLDHGMVRTATGIRELLPRRLRVRGGEVAEVVVPGQGDGAD
jgi:hypothetical protein